MIQLRNFPDTLHRKLKARAATEGLSLSEYLLSHIREFAEHPTLLELPERLRRREPVEVGLSLADVLREERKSRGLSWMLQLCWSNSWAHQRDNVFGSNI